MRAIESGPLTLVPQTRAHAEEMFAVLSDPAIYTYENAPPASVEWLRNRFEKLESRQSADGSEQWLNWVLRLEGTGLIGYVQATVRTDGSAAIAYELGSAHWGRGLARRATEAMIAELIGRYGVTLLYAVAKERNHRSLRLLGRLGFVAAAPEFGASRGVEPDEAMMVRVVAPVRASRPSPDLRDRSSSGEGGVMNIESFIEEAWKDHADRPEEVAARLAGALPMLQSPAHVAPFAAIVIHVYGEHLARWDEGVDLLQSLRAVRLNGADSPGALNGADSTASRAIDRGIAILKYAANAEPALANLSVEDQATVLATSASTLAAQREFGRAIDAFAAALRLAAPGLPPASPALRALAVAGNNLAVSLEEKADRDPRETHGMVAAAEGGLKYWQAAGTWLEHERAEYRLAKSLLQAGAHAEAVLSARRCVDICEANDAPAFERFFGCAVLAIAERHAGNRPAFEASRERALEQYAMIAVDERRWCEADRRKLEEQT